MSKIFAVRVHVQYYISCEQFIICQIRNFLAVCLWISRQTRFFRRIPHFPRSWGARAPWMWPFLDKSFSVGKGNSILLRSQLTVAINNLYCIYILPLRTMHDTFVLSYFRKYFRKYESTYEGISTWICMLHVVLSTYIQFVAIYLRRYSVFSKVQCYNVHVATYYISAGYIDSTYILHRST